MQEIVVPALRAIRFDDGELASLPPIPNQEQGRGRGRRRGRGRGRDRGRRMEQDNVHIPEPEPEPEHEPAPYYEPEHTRHDPYYDDVYVPSTNFSEAFDLSNSQVMIFIFLFLFIVNFFILIITLFMQYLTPQVGASSSSQPPQQQDVDSFMSMIFPDHMHFPTREAQGGIILLQFHIINQVLQWKCHMHIMG